MLWVYIKANHLQDPSDKRKIICNEPLRLVMSAKTVTMFNMNKRLTSQIFPIEDERELVWYFEEGCVVL